MPGHISEAFPKAFSKFSAKHLHLHPRIICEVHRPIMFISSCFSLWQALHLQYTPLDPDTCLAASLNAARGNLKTKIHKEIYID
ncbi:hypothetical protein BDZ45DRAFT_734850 [Acephala macrosclerotiorum]|nr:hypothetical protein BDZ45DRAFT_734850 [Acephala macrosclerotiorum]